VKIKVTRISQMGNRVLYDGPAIEHDYPITDFFKIVANSRGDGEGVNLRFGYINTEREKIEVKCVLTPDETIKMYTDLVGWLSSIIEERKMEIKAEVK